MPNDLSVTIGQLNGMTWTGRIVGGFSTVAASVTMGLFLFRRVSVGLRNIALLFGAVIFLGSLAIVETAAQQSDQPDGQRFSSEYYLPANTRAWVSVPNLQVLNQHLDRSQLGLLSKDPALQPFIDSARNQMRKWMEEKGIKFEFSLEDFDEIKTGEISIAGILPDVEGTESMAGTHGIVFLVDASKDIASVNDLVQRVDGQLNKRGAQKEMLEVNGVAVTKWQYPEKRKWAKRKRVSFQAIADGWFLVSDNEIIFRQVLRRILKVDDPQVAGNLASQESFRYALSRCNLGVDGEEGLDADVRWFIEPFGYVKLARAIEIENEPVKKMEDDWTAVLAANGLRAIRSVAGAATIATDSKEAFFRLFIHAPKDKTRNHAEARMLSILDFSPFDSSEIDPPKWVPKSISGVFTAQWDFSKALAGIGPIVDSFLKEEGAFNDLLDTVKNEPDFRVDIPKLVGQINKRFTLISETQKPLELDSEKLAVGFELVANMSETAEAEMIDSIARAIRGELIDLAGFRVVVDDRTEEAELDDDFDFEDAGLPFEEEEDQGKFEGGDNGGQAFALFEKKYIAIAKGYLFISNDKDYLKKLLTRSDEDSLTPQSDFSKMKDTISKYVDVNKVRATRFGRIDKVLELNYDMIKKGELANSKSLLGKAANAMLSEEGSSGEPAQVKLDVSQLPDDYEEAIAKYLGTMGWMTENEPGGWRITGCVLKKDAASSTK
jgi:hypothetical protein